MASEARAQIEMMANAVEMYRMENNVLQKSLEDLKVSFGYDVHEADPWGNSYIYQARGDSFEIRSQGPDTETEEDDIIHSSGS